MELKIVSTEIIKPSSPTPPHLYKLTLSLLDQKYSSLIVPVLLFYAPPPHEAAPPLDIGRLKTCLAETLTVFYPLAGRVESAGSILCNDEGIPFVEARATCSMSSALELLSSRSNEVAGFYPPRVGLIEEGVQISIQVTVFTCGGFCIGWYHTHKVTDGTSMGNFFRYWAALLTRQNDNVSAESAAQDLADFSSAVRVFPPVVLQEEKPVTPELNHKKKEIHDTGNKNKDPSPSSSFNFQFQDRILVRSFVINNEAVAKLKAISISDEVPNPSRFEAVAGFLWKSILSLNPSKEGRSALNVAIDLRPRVDPPLSVGVMGNLFETMLVQSEKSAELHELVAKIRGSILKTKELALEYQGKNREEAKNMHWKKFINAVIECKGKDVYVMTPWCKSAGFSDVDFGFGNPKWVIPIDDVVNHNQRNMIILTEFGGSDEGGFEAWLFLDEQCIKVLESSPEFHVFASPKF